MNSWNVELSIFKWTVIFTALVFNPTCEVSSLGSMSSIAVSYGEKGSVLCVLKPSPSNSAECYGSNDAIVDSTPDHLSFRGLTGGSGFVCGILMDSKLPFCWGSSGHIPLGVPLRISGNSGYVEISAGDNHLCGLRKPLIRQSGSISIVDCWGYNMTKSYNFEGEIRSISAGSLFSCGLFVQNMSILCWGDEIAITLTRLIPKELRFRRFAAGGFHVCGILEGVNSRVVCWGTLDPGVVLGDGPVEVFRLSFYDEFIPGEPMVSVAGGKFHACGIRRHDRTVVCWGYGMKSSTPPPGGVKLDKIAAGDYFTCGVPFVPSLIPVCWGVGVPSALPLPADPGLCKLTNCQHGSYEFRNASGPCRSPGLRVCLPCSNGCPDEMHQIAECSLTSDRICQYNCSLCSSNKCITNCSNAGNNSGHKDAKVWSPHFRIIAEVYSALFLVIGILLLIFLYVRYKLRRKRSVRESNNCSEHQPDADDLKIRNVRVFTYEELDRATGGFKKESMVGKGSFSCVFKGVLTDGTTVAVKRANVPGDMKSSAQFNTELDLLSRLNHTHLLSLLGYFEGEGEGERLLVYEFMANGSLYEHLHGQNKALREPLDWIKRVTIAVQAARGIEYLHGYACPPVIHRDIKSSNILIDEEYNARVADFGLSLLGPTNGSSPLSEPPAGTFGYLDPEYYRLHYLTTKSDVYSFGVLLLEILSGRKAVDMQYEEGNIVEWAVPLIRADDIEAFLDPVLECPPNLQALIRIANVACKCVRMRGTGRPSMDQVTTALEQAVAMLLGSPSNEQPILPSEVVLGSKRLHTKPSQRFGMHPALQTDQTDTMDRLLDFRMPSWITIPSSTSSLRRPSTVSLSDHESANIKDGKWHRFWS